METTDENSGQSVATRWRHRAKLAVLGSAAISVLAIGLYVTGVGLYFSNFNFAAGGDGRGALLLLIAICVGLVGLISQIAGLVAGWMDWKATGSRRWFVAAISLPAVELFAFAIVWAKM